MDFTPLDQHQVLLFLVQLLLLVGLARLLGGLMRWIGQPRWWESSWRGCCSAHPGGRSSRAHRPEGEGLVVEERHLEEATHAASNVVASAVELGQRLGVAVDPMIRLAPHPEQEIIELANGGQFDLLVLGTSTRPFSDRPYLGHRAHYILDRARIPVAVVSLPAFGIGESR